METLERCGAGTQPAATCSWEALVAPTLPPPYALLGSCFSCVVHHKPLSPCLSQHTCWHQAGVSLPPSQVQTSPLCVSFQGPSKKERFGAEDLPIPAFFLIYRGSLGQVTELFIRHKKYRALKSQDSTEDPQMHLAQWKQPIWFFVTLLTVDVCLTHLLKPTECTTQSES